MVTLWSTSIFISVVSRFIFSSLGILEFSIMEPNQWCEPLSSDIVWLWRNNNCGFQHQGGDIFLEKRNKDLRRRVQHFSSYHFIVHDLPLCSRGVIFKKNEFCIKFWVWLLQKIRYLPIQMMSWMHKWSHQWVICTFSHEKKICMPFKDLKVEHLAFSVAPQFFINVFSSSKGLFLKQSDHHRLDTTFMFTNEPGSAVVRMTLILLHYRGGVYLKVPELLMTGHSWVLYLGQPVFCLNEKFH